jgi:hypothetical protein
LLALTPIELPEHGCGYGAGDGIRLEANVEKIETEWTALDFLNTMPTL